MRYKKIIIIAAVILVLAAIGSVANKKQEKQTELSRSAIAETVETVALTATPAPTPKPAATPKPEPTAPPAKDYVLNTSSMKFHKKTCSSVKDIAEWNRKDFTGTREDVIAMGYEPCGKCHP